MKFIFMAFLLTSLGTIACEEAPFSVEVKSVVGTKNERDVEVVILLLLTVKEGGNLAIISGNPVIRFEMDGSSRTRGSTKSGAHKYSLASLRPGGNLLPLKFDTPKLYPIEDSSLAAASEIVRKAIVPVFDATHAKPDEKSLVDTKDLKKYWIVIMDNVASIKESIE